MIFNGASIKAKSGQTKSLVVLLHGYGASGDDLISLGRQWSAVLPDTDFIAPNAPQVCEQNPGGYQWCSLRDWDPHRLAIETAQVTPSLNAYVDKELKARNLGHDKLAFVGFSQGTFMSLDVALHRPACAGVVGYSGGYIHDATRLIIARPPVLLIHGEEDTVLEPQSSMAAEQQLKHLGSKVELHLIPDLDHSIDVQGLGLGAGFLKQNLMEN